MNSHVGMHQETGSASILLYVIGLIIILAIICYWYASKLKKENVSKLKIDEIFQRRQRRKNSNILGHILVGLSIVISIIYLVQETNDKYDVKSLNFNVPIEVNDDKYYGAEHSDDPVKYEMKIPTSGTHSPHDLKFGFYKEKPTNEMLVHNLEHGDIIIYYRPDADPVKLKQLEYFAKYTEAGAGILAVPNDNIPTGKEIVVTAWTKTMELDSIDEQKIGTFIFTYINKGPEVIPPQIRRGGGTM